jgi:hypothetical protein
VELLTITQWVKVRGDFYWYWWNCWPSLTCHLNSLSDVNNSTNINKNHLSLQLIEWWLTIPPISTKINELKWEVIFFYIGGIVDITQWVDVRGDFCWYWWNCWPSLNELKWEVISTNINKNHLSPKLIEWWSTIPPISANTTSHLNSLSDGQQFHQYQ